MQVECPNCDTRYRVSDSLITTPNPTFRCSRCKHVFAPGAKPETESSLAKTPLSSSAAKEDLEDNRELTFSFLSAPAKEAPEAKASDEPDEPPQLSTDESPSRVEEPSQLLTDRPFTISDEDPSPWRDDHPEASPEFETKWEPPSGTDQDEAVPVPEPHRPLSTLPYLGLFGGLVLLYSVLALFHQAGPRTAEAVIKNIPWLGSAVFRNNHLRQAVELQSLRPSFQRVLGKRELFVISGVAMNRNPVTVRDVRIEAQVYNHEGKEIERQVISIGNAISSKILRDLTAQEISILQKLSPQKGFEIPPEKSATFVIVFQKPRGEIKSFSCRVLAAKEA